MVAAFTALAEFLMKARWKGRDMESTHIQGEILAWLLAQQQARMNNWDSDQTRLAELHWDRALRHAHNTGELIGVSPMTLAPLPSARFEDLFFDSGELAQWAADRNIPWSDEYVRSVNPAHPSPQNNLVKLIKGAADLGESANAVKWDIIREIPAYELRETVALSLGLSPGLGRIEWAEQHASYINQLRNNPYFDLQEKKAFLTLAGVDEDDPSLDVSYQLMMRLKIAAKNIEPFGTLQVIERGDDALQSMVRLTDFAGWAENQGWVLPAEFPRQVQHASGEPQSAIDVEPMQRQRAQDQEIVRTIEDLGYSIDRVPKWSPGKPGVKAAVWERLRKTRAFGESRSAFNKAWERLRKTPDFNEV